MLTTKQKNISEEEDIMHIRLTLQEKLRDLREEKGLKLEELSKQIGISKSALGQYENDEGKEIGHKHICMLAQFYNVSSDYLVGLSENRNPVNTEIRDLHLQDKTIELLRSGKLNNRLICELIEHEDFPVLSADIEAYVDRWVEKLFSVMDTYFWRVRGDILNSYDIAPDKEALKKQLDTLRIQEDEFFKQKVAAHFCEIISSIKKNHIKDGTTAPNVDIGLFVSDLKKYMNLVAAPSADSIFDTICDDYGIDAKDLTDKQIESVKKVLKKSIFLKTGNRGKNK